MYEFLDYHRTVVAFHGTRTNEADRLVSGHPFRFSDNTDDWLGGGVYFWEYAPKQAWWWAKEFKKYEGPAVVGAMIRLGNCFDLLDPANVQSIKGVHAAMMKKWHSTDTEIPQNGNQHKNLDCAVFNHFYELAAEKSRPIDTARSVYVPTKSAKRIWKRSWIYEEAHIQICVRNQQNILAVWHVGTDGRYGKH
jgi:hypothetical protein